MAVPISKIRGENADLLAEIERRSGMRVADCYQCGRCSSTCTGAIAFDLLPHRLIRLLQLGMVHEVLRSKTAQICFDCMTCSLRCPAGIDLAMVIEASKNMAEEMGLKSTEKTMRVFKREFLKNVRRHGRLHEPSLLTWINVKTGKPLNDVSLAPQILRKRKVHVVPPRIRNLRNIRRLFREVDQKGKSAGEEAGGFETHGSDQKDTAEGRS